MATEEQRIQLRKYLADEDGAFFDDDAIDALIDSEATMDLAAAKGWRYKAASYAELVDTSEGTSKRAMSDLHKNALAMVESFGPSESGGSSGVTGVTRSRPLVRR